MKLIDFYSYKGGAGRSVTTLNTIPFIAQSLNASPEKPLIVFDMDLESAGITFLVEEDKTFSKKNDDALKDVRDYLDGVIHIDNIYRPDEICPILKNSVDISKKVGYPIENSILFMGVDDFDILKEYSSPSDLKKKIGSLKKYFRETAGLVFDSASGAQAISQTLINCSHEIVVCLKVTSQFRHGTLRFLEKIIFDSHEFKRGKITLLPVAISKSEAKANRSMTYKKLALKDLQDKIEVFEKRISKDDNLQIEFNKVFLKEENFGIPEIESFKWQEKNLFYEKSRDITLEEDEEIGYRRFKLLGEELSK